MSTQEYVRFQVHPDKLLVRVYPITGDVVLPYGGKLWLPPSAQRREANGRWAKILQVGKRIQERYPDVYTFGDIVFCNKYVDLIFGTEGKFKLGGKLVAVTTTTEVLMVVEFEKAEEVPYFIRALP